MIKENKEKRKKNNTVQYCVYDYDEDGSKKKKELRLVN